ncbi:hypothetical protein ES703_73792 [subsurface metagenome]
MTQRFKVGDNVKVVGHVHRNKKGIIVGKGQPTSTKSQSYGSDIVSGELCFWKIKTTTGEVVEVAELDLEHV